MSLEELSSALDSSFPGISEVLAADDFTSAFASFIRGYLDSTRDRYFSIPYEVPENVYKLEGESDRDACDRIVTGTLVSVGVPSAFGSTKDVDWHSNPTFNGYKEWTWQFSRHNDVKLLAHEYLLTGNHAYAEAAADLISTWIDTCPVPGPDVDGHDTDCWRTIECGIRMGANWPYIIYAFYREFSDDLIARIFLSMHQHGVRLMLNHTQGNWLLMEMNGLCYIAVICPFFKESGKWSSFALSSLEEEAGKQFYADGFQYELTTNYHDVAVNNYQRMLQLLKAFGRDLPGSLNSILLNATEANIKLMEPDGMLPDINDGNTFVVKELLEPKARLFTSPQMEWVLSGGKKGEIPYKSIALPYSGFFAFRSGWGREDIYGLLDSAPFGRMHQHEDKLSLLVSNGEKRVINEGGCYAYDASDIRTLTLSSFSHNVLIIDGMGQNRRKGYCWHDEDIRKLSDLRSGISDSVDWAEGSYSGPYGEDEEYPAAWTRSVYFLKKHEGFSRPFFIVVDRIDGKESHEFCLLWHVDSERLSIGKESASFADVQLSFAGGSTLSVTNGSLHPAGGIIATGKQQGMYKGVDRLEYRTSGKSAKMITVISFEDKEIAVNADGDAIVLSLSGREYRFKEEDLRS